MYGLTSGPFCLWPFFPFPPPFRVIFLASRLARLCLSLNLLAIGVGMFLQWKYATGKDRLVEPGIPPHFVRQVGFRALVVPFISLAGILIALMGITWSTAVYLFIPVVHIIIVRFVRRKPEYSV